MFFCLYFKFQSITFITLNYSLEQFKFIKIFKRCRHPVSHTDCFKVPMIILVLSTMCDISLCSLVYTFSNFWLSFSCIVRLFEERCDSIPPITLIGLEDTFFQQLKLIIEMRHLCLSKLLNC